MNAEVFWQVIENYNQQTYIIQIVLLIAIITAIILSYCRVANWTVKFALGITNLFNTFCNFRKNAHTILFCRTFIYKRWTIVLL